MTRSLRFLLLVAALLFSQHAAILHGLSHAGQEVQTARSDSGKAPVSDHAAEICAAFAAFAHALGMAIAPVSAAAPAVEAFAAPLSLISPATPRAAFDPRAPPRFA